MICDEMLERMLDAEPAELEGKGATLLARHVRECARCGAVARQLRADETALAAASARVPHRTTVRATEFAVHARYPRHVTPASVGTALIAASALFLLLRSGDVREPDLNAPPIAAPEVPEVVGTAPLPAIPNRRGQNDLAQPAFVPPPPPVLPARVLARAFPSVPAVIVATADGRAARREPAASAEVSVIVAAPPGKRATVLAGGSSKITVVWLR